MHLKMMQQHFSIMWTFLPREQLQLEHLSAHKDFMETYGKWLYSQIMYLSCKQPFSFVLQWGH